MVWGQTVKSICLYNLFLKKEREKKEKKEKRKKRKERRKEKKRRKEKHLNQQS